MYITYLFFFFLCHNKNMRFSLHYIRQFFIIRHSTSAEYFIDFIRLQYIWKSNFMCKFFILIINMRFNYLYIRRACICSSYNFIDRTTVSIEIIISRSHHRLKAFFLVTIFFFFLNRHATERREYRHGLVRFSCKSSSVLHL